MSNFAFSFLNNLFKEKTFKERVLDDLVSIVIQEQGISEKDFQKIDNIKSTIQETINNHTYINNFISKMKDKRSQLVAELIYDEIKSSILV